MAIRGGCRRSLLVDCLGSSKYDDLFYLMTADFVCLEADL